MSRNGSGVYSLPAGNPVVTNTTISTTWANTTLTDLATAMTGSVASDGQTPITGNLQMGNNRVTGLADGIVATDAATVSQLPNTALFLLKASNLSDVASASTSRTNLGLGTIATQAASAIAVTGGAIDGTTIGTTTRSTVKATALDLGLSTQSVAIGQGNSSIMKNRLINGEMLVNQRSWSGTITNTSALTYTLDRWAAYGNVASKFSVAQNGGPASPAGFSNYLGVTSLSAYAVASSDGFTIRQNIEGFNTYDLNWGTNVAKTVTLSFQVYSSLTGTFGGVVRNGAANYSYPFTYSIPTANTWTTISVTIAGPTSGTWQGATNLTSVAVLFGLGVGSTLSGTAGSWSANAYESATGAVSVVGTNGAVWYVTGVQFEVGSQATGYEYVNYQTLLANCQRYYQLQTISSYGTSDGSSTVFNGTYVPKRATPTNSFTANFSITGSGAAVDGYGIYGSGVHANYNVGAVISDAEL